MNPEGTNWWRCDTCDYSGPMPNDIVYMSCEEGHADREHRTCPGCDRDYTWPINDVPDGCLLVDSGEIL